MTRYSLLLIFALGYSIFASAQQKNEREHRIRKSQFPSKGLEYIETKVVEAKHLRYYKEIDSSQVTYETKFKKDRLWYNMEFDSNGKLEGVAIVIKQIDLPEETLEALNSYLSQTFKKYKIRKIQQQYLVNKLNTAENTLKKAFQNLLLPEINYELIVTGKKDAKKEQFEVLFNAEGNLIDIRNLLPANYDHVLY